MLYPTAAVRICTHELSTHKIIHKEKNIGSCSGLFTV